MQKSIAVLLIIAGVIHLLPLSGAIGGQQLALLYGVSFDEPNLAILMRHRAVLFGLGGVFLIYAAFEPQYRAAALLGGLVSVLSFLYLAWSTGGYNRLIGHVVMADLLALACLLPAALLQVLAARADLSVSCR